MSLFDLLFLALFGVSVAVLGTAAAAALRGRGEQARRTLKGYGACFAGYMAVVAGTSLLLPRRVLGVGEPLCSDDWCLAVESVDKAPSAGGVTYRIGLRISSVAKRVTQREYGVSVCLADARGRRWPPRPSAEDVPFDTAIGPGETIAASRVFELPPEARPEGLIIRHDTGFPIGWFIIGYDTWFRKPAMVRLSFVPRPPA